MIIVSNERVMGKKVNYTYQQFVELAFSDAGLDSDGDMIMINIHDMDDEVFSVTKDVGEIGYFTLTGTAPGFCTSQVEDWSDLAEDNETQTPDLSNIPTLSNDFMDSATPDSIMNLLSDSGYEEEIDSGNEKKDAKVFVFGSSKGGTGKTFTAIISTYRYAKTHPHQKIALIDFDIIDGQVGISIHKINPTLKKYYTEYQKGYKDYRTMKEYAVKANPPYPQNVDFFLAPSNGSSITNYQFWLNVIKNACENYDVVVFDTGIDYINLPPISFVYKAADKILLVTTTSIKSVNSVTKQIGRLKGEIPSRDQFGEEVFSAEDNIAPHLNVIITQMQKTNRMNEMIYSQLAEKANVIATFGIITDSISKAEFYGAWDVFDKNDGINRALDDIMS